MLEHTINGTAMNDVMLGSHLVNVDVRDCMFSWFIPAVLFPFLV